MVAGLPKLEGVLFLGTVSTAQASHGQALTLWTLSIRGIRACRAQYGFKSSMPVGS
jgi:hypothetical protein